MRYDTLDQCLTSRTLIKVIVVLIYKLYVVILCSVYRRKAVATVRHYWDVPSSELSSTTLIKGCLYLCQTELKAAPCITSVMVDSRWVCLY